VSERVKGLADIAKFLSSAVSSLRVVSLGCFFAVHFNHHFVIQIPVLIPKSRLLIKFLLLVTKDHL